MTVTFLFSIRGEEAHIPAVFRDDEVLYAAADTQDTPSTWSIRRALLAGGTRDAIPVSAPPEQLVIEASRRLFWMQNDWTLHTLILDQTSGTSTNLIAGSAIVGVSSGAIVRLGYVGGTRQTVRIDSGMTATPFTSNTSSEQAYQAGSRADADSNTSGYFVLRDDQSNASVFRPQDGDDITPLFVGNEELTQQYGVLEWDAAMVSGSSAFVPARSSLDDTLRVVRVDLSSAD